MESLRRELAAGLRPIHETFVALVRLFGSKGRAIRGLEILAAMETLNFDIRQAWLVLIGIIIFIFISYPANFLFYYEFIFYAFSVVWMFFFFFSFIYLRKVTYF